MDRVQGNIVDIHNRLIFPGEVCIRNNKIDSINRLTSAPDQYIIPGFIDSHVHIESSMMLPSEFARLAVCHGTIGTISDPHEIGNVLGKKGVRFMIDNGLRTPFKFHFGAPSCVPATDFETSGAVITLKDIEEIFQWPNVNYLAEVMNFPGVLHKDPEVIAKIELAKQLNKQVDGHAPGLMGQEAIDYISAGITTDHECFTKEEALNKIENGMKIIIREGSAAKNFEALWELIDAYPDMTMFCSDDKHPNDLMVGHIDLLVKRAIAKGADLFNVLRAASLTPKEHYKMNTGALSLGDPADFCIVNNLTEFKVLQTYIDGACVYENKTSKIEKLTEEPINQFNCNPIKLDQIRLPYRSNQYKVITVADGQLITGKTLFSFSPCDYIESDLDNDILKLVVVNRYSDAKPAISFIKNVGLKKGAFASCIAHDSHNIIACGTNDVDIVNAINAIITHKGGISVALGNAIEELPLPVAGIMSNQSGEWIGEHYSKLDLITKEYGCTLSAPFMTLSFCALLVIPSLKLSDMGLFDGEQFELTDSFV